MIVRSGRGLLHLITQPDHAALSRRIMEHWAPLEDAQRRASILHAIGEHDNGWRELDDHPAIDGNGRVVDFVNAPAGPKRDVWPRGVERLADDPFAAALVAQHAVTVYDRYRTDAEWQTFFPEMAALRDRHLDVAGIAHEDLLRDYFYVRLGDLISLAFCTGWKDEQHYNGCRVQLEDERHVAVSPGSFDLPEFAIEVHALELPDRRFESDSAFRSTLSNASRTTLTGRVWARYA